LTPLQQEAVWRFHLQGMKQSQVATFLPEGAQVASAIYMGVRKLAGIPENAKEIKTPKLKIIREGEYHDWPGVTGPKAKHDSTPELRTKLELQKSLSALPLKEKQALALRFGHAQSPEEIKEKLSLNSVAEVRFLMAKSLKALRLNPEDLAQHSQSLKEIPLTSNMQESK